MPCIIAISIQSNRYECGNGTVLISILPDDKYILLRTNGREIISYIKHKNTPCIHDVTKTTQFQQTLTI